MSCDFWSGTLWFNKDYQFNVKEWYQFEKYNLSACSQSPDAQVAINMDYESMRDKNIISIYVIKIHRGFVKNAKNY